MPSYKVQTVLPIGWDGKKYSLLKHNYIHKYVYASFQAPVEDKKGKVYCSVSPDQMVVPKCGETQSGKSQQYMHGGEQGGR